MPFVVVMFLVFALFMAARVPRGSHAIWLGLVLFTFACCILGLIGLITRFGNYRLEGLIVLPLDQPAWLGELLSLFSLRDFMRFRLWSLVGFVASVVAFSLSYTTERWGRVQTMIAAGFGLAAVGLLWFYDPEHLFAVFKWGTRYLGNPEAWETWTRRLEALDWFAFGLVVTALAYALGRLFWLWFHATISQKRAQALCVALGHAVIAVFFVFLFCHGPAKVLNARAMATKLLPVAGYPVFDITLLLAVPFAGLAAMGAVFLSIWRFGFLGAWHMGTRDLERRIKVANQAIRLALHSFKNRFLAVQMALNMAADEMTALDTAADKARTHLDWARDVCREALAQLDVLHVQAGWLQSSLTVCSWRSLWEEAMHRCKGRSGGVEIEIVDKADGVYVWGDREQLVSVLENLLQNAFDAFAAVERQERAPRIRAVIGKEFEWGYIRIADNGPGIPRMYLRKVFRPFFTTKPSKTNWGMGLAFCHRVVKAHGGYINLRSIPGSGTMVEVVLRRRADTAPAIGHSGNLASRRAPLLPRGNS